MLDPVDEPLVQEILTVLELDHQYTRLVEEWNHDLVARSDGAAGRPGNDWATGSEP